jgi:serine/threonine-protein kinase
MGHSMQPLGKGLLCYEAGRTAPLDLVCRKADTGAVMWRSPFQKAKPDLLSTGDLQPLDELVSGTTVFLPYAAGSRRTLAALDGATGKQAWTYGGAYEEADLQWHGTTSVAGGFLLRTGSGVVCLAARDGARRWQADAREAQTSGGYALLSTTGQARVLQRWTSVRILDLAHGRTLWTGQFDASAVSAPAASGNSVVVLDGSGTVWAMRVGGTTA